MSKKERKPNKDKQNRHNRRFADLAKMGEVLFHADDLASLWGIQKKGTLHQTLSRYVASSLLHRIYRGFYALKEPDDIDDGLLGVKALHGYAYVSCESVLFREGIINQPSAETTLVSDHSKRFVVAGRRFRSRRLAPLFLYNETGVETVGGVRTASISRAVADLLYFNSKAYFDAHGSRLIDWGQVRAVARAVGYRMITPKP